MVLKEMLGDHSQVMGVYPLEIMDICTKLTQPYQKCQSIGGVSGKISKVSKIHPLGTVNVKTSIPIFVQTCR